MATDPYLKNRFNSIFGSQGFNPLLYDPNSFLGSLGSLGQGRFHTNMATIRPGGALSPDAQAAYNALMGSAGGGGIFGVTQGMPTVPGLGLPTAQNSLVNNFLNNLPQVPAAAAAAPAPTSQTPGIAPASNIGITPDSGPNASWASPPANSGVGTMRPGPGWTWNPQRGGYYNPSSPQTSLYSNFGTSPLAAGPAQTGIWHNSNFYPTSGPNSTDYGALTKVLFG